MRSLAVRYSRRRSASSVSSSAAAARSWSTRSRAARRRRHRARLRPRHHGDDLRGRPRLRRPSQPGGEPAFGLSRHFPLRRVGFYWVAQCAGAIAAAAVLRLPGRCRERRGAIPSGSDAQSFLWEVVLTFFLMFVIMAVATDTRAVGRRQRSRSAAPSRSALVGARLGRVDEPRALARPRAGVDVRRTVGLPRGSSAGRCTGRSRVPCGAIVNVYFVCIGNAGRSQMAEAFAKQAGLEARSAGSRPAAELDAVVVVDVMRSSVSISAGGHLRNREEDIKWADVVVTMGCGDGVPGASRQALPRLGAARSVRAADRGRAIWDDIRRRIDGLSESA